MGIMGVTLLFLGEKSVTDLSSHKAEEGVMCVVLKKALCVALIAICCGFFGGGINNDYARGEGAIPHRLLPVPLNYTHTHRRTYYVVEVCPKKTECVYLPSLALPPTVDVLTV